MNNGTSTYIPTLSQDRYTIIYPGVFGHHIALCKRTSCKYRLSSFDKFTFIELF